MIRADLVSREWEDFYSDRITLETGQVLIGGTPADLREIGNFGDNALERDYIGLHLNFRYRVTDRLNLAVAYALSELEGNINGETSQNGPIGTESQRVPRVPFLRTVESRGASGI